MSQNQDNKGKVNHLMNSNKSQLVIDNIRKKEKEKEKEKGKAMVDSKEEEKKKQRQQRFNMNNNGNSGKVNQMTVNLKNTGYGIDGEADFEKLSQKWKITGTCEKLEKEFIRL